MIRSGILSKILSVICFVSACYCATAQVSNNNIKDRTELILDANPVHSNTANSSVEWDCVNKSLTNKCLIYHNDQWFHFTPHTNGKFFLNISSQQCRDLRGIQAIVIEGNPCEVKTYRILQCISKIHQDDVFIELDSLKSGMQYLVNIDGFLGDFCQFEIRWSIPEVLTDEIRNFKIFRLGKGEQKSTLIKELPLRANALGDYDHEYSIDDSLSIPNAYTYRIFGIQKNSEYPFLLDEKEIAYYDRNKAPAELKTWVYIPLKLKGGSPYQVLVFNRVDYSLLRKYAGEFDEAKDSTFEMNLHEFIKAGVKEFIILASEVNSNQPKEFYFQFDGKRIVGN